MAAEPGRIIHRFDIPDAVGQRDDDFVHRTTVQFLQHRDVRDSFGLL